MGVMDRQGPAASGLSSGMTSSIGLDPGRVEGLPWRSALAWGLVAAIWMVAPGGLSGGWSLSLGLAVALLANLGFQTLLQGAGLLSFGHALYLGLGAWLMALALRGGWVSDVAWLVWPWLVAGATAMVAWGIAFLQARRGGVAFAMISLGLAEALAQGSQMLPSWFGGDAGWAVSRPVWSSSSGIAVPPTATNVALAAVASAALVVMAWRVGLAGPRALLWQAQAADDERLEALGQSSQQIRRRAMAWAAAPLGMAGAWMVWWSERFSAEWLSAARSADLLVIGVLGLALSAAVVSTLSGLRLLRPVWTLGAAATAGAWIMVWAEHLGPAWSEAWGLWLGLAFGWVVWQGQGGLLSPLQGRQRQLNRAPLEEQGCQTLARALPAVGAALGVALLTHAQWQARWSAQAEPLIQLLGRGWPLTAVDLWVGLVFSTTLCAGLAGWSRAVGRTGLKARETRALQTGQMDPPEPSDLSVRDGYPEAAVSQAVDSGERPAASVDPQSLDDLSAAPAHPPASGQVVLSLQGLQVHRGRQVVLRGLDLRVHEGEILALVGPNGAGKSTLLEALSGRLNPSQGELMLNGRSLAGLTVSQRARAGLARSFQGTRVFETLTVRQHLQLATLGAEPRLAAQAINLANALGLDSLLEVRADDLGPEALRCLELAMTLSLPGHLVLLDEPTAGLNASAADRVVRLLAKVLHGRTAIVVEHDLSVVRRLCDRVAILAEGQILCSGSPDLVLADPRVRALYGSDEDAQPESPVSVPAQHADQVLALLGDRTSSPEVLRLRAIDVDIQGRSVLRKVSFALHRGEVLAVRGAPGSGRSTLLRAIMGLCGSRGEIILVGQSLASLDAAQRARLGCCWVPDDRGLMLDLSVIHHLRLAWWGSQGRGADLPGALRQVWERFPRLAERQQVLAGSLSGGERQMLALARCWLVNPTVLLLDEPAEGLSPQALSAAEAVLRELSARGAAIIVTEDKPVLSGRLAQRVLTLHRGDVLASF
jgi:ABC-type branched-subunit amino acid transport system ATPase component/ABC-type branched-subunit amino acid transport system permease subunit